MEIKVVCEEKNIEVKIGDIIEINDDFFIVMENIASSKKRLRHLNGVAYYGADFENINEVVKKPFKHYSRDEYELQLVKKEDK